MREIERYIERGGKTENEGERDSKRTREKSGRNRESVTESEGERGGR